MTIKELAKNWIENDRDGDYSGRAITMDEAQTLIGFMDADTLESIGEDVSAEKFMDAWNSVVSGV